MGHTDFLRVDEQGQEEWVRCGPGDTLVAPMCNWRPAMKCRSG
jgi:hypothetical protein